MNAFETCHAITHRWERGYANHPRDPGGATMDGVTQRVYDAYRRKRNEPRQHVRAISEREKADIYREQYWEAVRGDHLPPGIDLAVYDMAVNSGPKRAIRYLQAALGLKQDGHLGLVTLAAAREAYDRDEDDDVIARYMDARDRFLRGLDTFDVFGKGWMNRTRDIRARAQRMEQIEDEARVWSGRAKTNSPDRTPPKPGRPEIYKPELATNAPAEPVVRAEKAAKTSGFLGGLGAIAIAMQTVVGGVREALNGLVPEGSTIALTIVILAAGGAALYAWQQLKEADADKAKPEQGALA